MDNEKVQVYQQDNNQLNYNTHSILLGILDSQGEFKQMSTALAQLLGYATSEEQLPNLFNLTHPLDREITETTLFQTYHSPPHSYHQVENRCQHREGTYLWLLWQMSLMPDGQQVQAVAIEISAYKQTPLREHLYRSTFETSRLAMMVLNQAGYPILVNRAFEQLLGYSQAEFVHVHFSEFVHPADVESHQAVFFALVSGQQHESQMEKRYLCRNGHIRWLHVMINGLKDFKHSETKVDEQFFLLTVEDISARKYAQINFVKRQKKQSLQTISLQEEAITQAVSPLSLPQIAKDASTSLILDNLNVLIYVSEIKTYKIMYINKYGRDLFGDITGKICWQAFWKTNLPKDKTPCEFCNVDKILSPNGAPKDVYVWESHSTYLRKWYLIHSRAVRWIDGRLVRLVFAYDISSYKHTEQTLRLHQQRFVLAAHAGKTGIWDWLVHTKELYIDNSFKRLLGYQDTTFSNGIYAWKKRVHRADFRHAIHTIRDYLRQLPPIPPLTEAQKFRGMHWEAITTTELAERGYTDGFELELRILHKNSQIRWIAVRGLALSDQQGQAYRLIGTGTDITERKMFEQSLQEHDRLLRGVAQITQTLLTVINDRHAIYKALKILGQLMNVDRSYIFENFNDPISHEVVIKQSFIWGNPQFIHRNFLGKLRNISYKHYLPGWYDTLNTREPISGLTKDFLSPTSTLLNSQGIISILIIPIHFEERFWGFIGVDDCRHERQWTQYEIFVLKVVGDSIRGAIARQQAKDSLQQSEAKFRTMIENNGDALLIIDKQGNILFANPAAEQLYKTPPGGLRGKNFGLPTSQQDKAEIEFIDQEGCQHVGVLRVSKTVWEGETVSIISLHDITDRKRAEEALRQSENQLKTITSNLPVFIFVLNSEGVFTLLRGKGLVAFGLQEDELVGQSVFTYYQNFPEMIESTLRALSGESFTSTLVFHELSFEMKYTPLFNQRHKPAGTIVLATDITERKQIEDELRRAKEVAEAANRSKSGFLAAMSHEIRTPMNGVVGMTQLLLNTPLSPQQHHYIEMIRSSGESLLTVINDILDFSKIEAGKLVLEIVEFNIRTVVEEVVHLFAASAQRKGIELLCDIPPNMSERVLGDPNRLRQILSNLLNNAVKFTNEGEILLRLTLPRETDTVAHFYFEVIDSGIGIKASAVHYLFKPFSQADNSTTRRYGGTGLGLDISRRLLQLMGGDIGLKTQEMRSKELGIPINEIKGSHFWFSLLLDKVEIAPFCPLPIAEQLRDVRVLIVDDNEHCRNLLSREAKNWNMLTDVMADIAQARSAIIQSATRDKPYQIILIDQEVITTEHENMFNAIQKDWNELPVVILLTPLEYSSTEWAQAMIQLQKPVRQNDLLHCLLLAINKKMGKSTPEQVIQHLTESSTKTRLRGRILLTEDNLVNQEVAKSMLEQLGCDVMIANNGVEALTAYEQGQFDLIFMDCHMPEMDGFEASGMIRKRENSKANARIPIVALTANAMQGDREQCLRAGMDDYLSKPIIFKDLKGILDKWIVPDIPKNFTPVSSPVEHYSSHHHPLDFELLDNLRQNIKDGNISWLLDLYLRELPNYLSELRQAVDTMDASSIRLAAHKFKGASANIGGQRIVQLCAVLEESSRQGILQHVKDLVEQLEVESQHLKEALEQAKQTRFKVGDR